MPSPPRPTARQHSSSDVPGAPGVPGVAAEGGVAGLGEEGMDTRGGVAGRDPPTPPLATGAAVAAGAEGRATWSA
eukprot:scaffold51392_cov37-Phaeocystis_antarctica.AAC.2